MELLGFTFTLLEAAVFFIFAIAFVWSAGADRYGMPAPKYWVVTAGILAYLWLSDLTFPQMWEQVRTWSFWKPVSIYVGLGLLYCIPEFLLTLNRARKKLAASWDEAVEKRSQLYFIGDKQTAPQGVHTLHDKGTTTHSKIINGVEHQVTPVDITPREMLRDIEENGTDSRYLEEARDFIRRFASFSSNYRVHPILRLVCDERTLKIEPAINRSELADHLAAWTAFWPGYLVASVIGDFLVNLFRYISDAVVLASRKLVQVVFSGTFKV